MLSKLSEEFDERNCKVLAIGLDSKMGHRSFVKETQVGANEGGASTTQTKLGRTVSSYFALNISYDLRFELLFLSPVLLVVPHILY